VCEVWRRPNNDYTSYKGTLRWSKCVPRVKNLEEALNTHLNRRFRVVGTARRGKRILI
jgi:hypothetical protein